MTTYQINLKKIQVLFIKEIGYTIHNRECAIEVLNKYGESRFKEIENVFFNGGLLQTTVTFK